MKIVYVAKHHSGGNDEEGAITWALEQLGHEVDRRHEKKMFRTPNVSGDLLLFHKWDDYARMVKFQMPKAFWYFDLVESSDATLSHRDSVRIEWMRRVTQIVDIGFCTDGDWVKKYNSSVRYPTLHVLRQGFDSRHLGTGRRSECRPKILCPPGSPEYYDRDLLMTAIRLGGGEKRVNFIDFMNSVYKGDITHLLKGTHGQALADAIVNHKMCVAPDYPVTDSYWSNRVYLTIGYGGVLLHPYSAELANDFVDKTDLLFYHSREELQEQIEALRRPEAMAYRIQVAKNGTEAIRKSHTYVHRCSQLLKIVKDEIGVS